MSGKLKSPPIKKIFLRLFPKKRSNSSLVLLMYASSILLGSAVGGDADSLVPFHYNCTTNQLDFLAAVNITQFQVPFRSYQDPSMWVFWPVSALDVVAKVIW